MHNLQGSLEHLVVEISIYLARLRIKVEWTRHLLDLVQYHEEFLELDRVNKALTKP